MKAICATCGGDLTIVEEIYDGKDILLPLVSISILPCCTCMSRAASEADEAAWYAGRADFEGEKGRGET